MGSTVWKNFTSGLWVNGSKDTNPEATLRRSLGLAAVRGAGLRARQGSVREGALEGTENINSIAYFGDTFWVGTDEGNLYRLVEGTFELIRSGFDGSPLRFLILPPAGGQADQLFISGGGPGAGLLKCSRTGVVEQWGIPAPQDGFTSTKLDPTRTVVTSAPGWGTTWLVTLLQGPGVAPVASGSAPFNLLLNPDQLVEGTRILGAVANLKEFNPLDLNPYESFPGSSDLDYIEFKIFVDDPQWLDFFQLSFDLTQAPDAGEFSTDFYSALFTTQTKGIQDPDSKIQPEGLEEYLQRLGKERHSRNRVQPGDKDYSNPKTPDRQESPRLVRLDEKFSLAELNSFFAPPQTISLNEGAWTTIKVPKSRFVRSGDNEDLDWANVTAVRVYFHTRKINPSSSATLTGTMGVTLGAIRLTGGYGTKGTQYNHQITYRDSRSGARSNANPTPVTTKEVDRQPWLISDLPVAEELTPTSADQLELWRTLGDGQILFLSQRALLVTLRSARAALGLGVGQLFDGVPDVLDFNLRDFLDGDGQVTVLEDETGVAFSDSTQAAKVRVGDQLEFNDLQWTVIGKPNSEVVVLDRTVYGESGNSFSFGWRGSAAPLAFFDVSPLPSDNLEPSRDFEDVTYGQGRVWWTSGAINQRSLVFFSPVGRPESAGLGEFLDLGADQEVVNRVVSWNGSLWVFSQARIYQVTGTGETESPFILREVAGSPGTLLPYTVTPTPVGILYQASDGLRVFDGTDAVPITEALAPIFTGESAENLTPFEGMAAAWNGRELFISDGAQLLAFDGALRRWREVGGGYEVLSYAPELGKLLAGRNQSLLSLDDARASGDEAVVNVEGQVVVPGVAFEVSWEVPSVAVNQGNRVLLRRLYIDHFFGAATEAPLITPTLILDTGEVELPPVQLPAGGTRRVTEVACSAVARVCGIRLTTEAALSPLEIYGIELEWRPLGAAEG